MEGGEHGEEGKPTAPPASVFAVRTAAGKEREVAEGIRDRALREKAEVRSAAAPSAMEGIVLVEATDFDRLTNLVASVGYARGVITPSGRGEASRRSVVPPERVADVLGGGTPPADELEEWLFSSDTLRAPAPRGEGRGRTPAPAVGADDEGAGREGDRGGEDDEDDSTDDEDEEEETTRATIGLTPRARLALNAAILAPVVILVVGLVAAPAVFWDRFLYPFFWESIEADASNAGGSAEAYNIVNTLAYALILVPALLFIYRVLERLKVRVDTRFVLMLSPFLVLGGAARALEDAQYFSRPVSYAFISPLIYVSEGLFVLALVVASWWVARVRERSGQGRAVLAWTAAFAPGAVALALFHTLPQGGLASPIPAPILLSAIGCAYLVGLLLLNSAKAPKLHGFVFNAGLLLLTLSAYLIARWVVLGSWEGDALRPAETHVGDVPAVVALAAGATVATAAGVFLASTRFPRLGSMLTPLTLLLFFAQYMDAAATYWGIEHWGYQEKHVVAGTLIAWTGTAAVMFPMKLGFVLLVGYMTDVWLRRDLYDSKGEINSFGGLLKLTVIALGMGPGTRDMLRMAMGV